MDLGGLFLLLVLVSTGSAGFDNDQCRRPTKAQCTALEFPCLGLKLPYAMTSNELVNPNFTQQRIQNEMSRWDGLRNAPKCWAVVQPLLCSFYMPKCLDGHIDLPSQELCRITRSPCKIVFEAINEWPEFLKCDDSSKFPSCKNNENLRELKFNTSSECMDPMIEQVNGSSDSYYEGFEGCGLKCKDPLFTDEEHETLSKYIKWLGLLTLTANGLVLCTFIIDWKSSKRYPSVFIFFINFCYLFATIGWMIQFLQNSKEEIVCRKDKTRRLNEPNSSENVFCVGVFIFVYFGSMAVLSWLVVFAYVWNLTCNTIGRVSDKLERDGIYFHVFSWFIPTVLTVAALVTAKIEGNSLAGICFLETSFPYRTIFLIAPLVFAYVVMTFFFAKGVYKLHSVSGATSDYIVPIKKLIKSHANRVIMFTIATSIIVFTVVSCQIYELSSIGSWRKSLRDQFICKMNLSYIAECESREKPHFNTILTSVICFFLSGILVSTWAWTRASFDIWKRFIFRLPCCREERSVVQPTVQKHKLISQAYQKRDQLPGRLSLSFYSAHEDPVGLNRLLDPLDFDNMQVRQSDVSSEWAAALPHLVCRRDALVPPDSSNSCLSEDNSEFAAKNFRSEHRSDSRSRRRDWFKMGRRRRFWPARKGSRGSSSSLESNPGSQILPAITALIENRRVSTMDHGVQTSLERLPITNGNNLNAATVIQMDKSTQSSCPALNEIATQTKKTQIKKLKRNQTEEAVDPVLEFLTPK